MSATPVDLNRARVSVDRNSAVVDDPDSPWLLRAWTRPDDTGRHRLVRLRVDVRRDGTDITAARLCRLPLQQIVHLAAAGQLPDTAHPNEAYYRLLARPRPPGQRHWDDGHYARVLQVYEWAEATGRPGGGVIAIAELWGIAAPPRSPTAYRWLAEARRRAAVPAGG